MRRYVPEYERVYEQRGWSVVRSIDRVYVNDLARERLGWRPRYDFAHVIRLLGAGEDYRSPLARAVGAKGYHVEQFAEGPYPTE